MEHGLNLYTHNGGLQEGRHAERLRPQRYFGIAEIPQIHPLSETQAFRRLSVSIVVNSRTEIVLGSAG